jgi:hypothetical protein
MHEHPPPTPTSKGVGFRAAREAEEDGEDMDEWFAGGYIAAIEHEQRVKSG